MASTAASGDDSETDCEEDVPLWARYALEDCDAELERLDAAEPAQHDAHTARRRARWQARLDALEAVADAEAPRVEALQQLRFVLRLPPNPEACSDGLALCEPTTWPELMTLLFEVNANSDCALHLHTAGETCGEGVPILPALMGQAPLPGLAAASGGVCADGLLPAVRA